MPTISRSITLNCGHYNTSESVMILYYNVIDPAAVLAPLSGAVQTAQMLQLNVMKRYWCDCTVKTTIISQGAVDTKVFGLSAAEI